MFQSDHQKLRTDTPTEICIEQHHQKENTILTHLKLVVVVRTLSHYAAKGLVCVLFQFW